MFNGKNLPKYCMKEYATKLTLYDFISMLMPGSIIAYCLMCLFISESDVIPMDNPFFWILFFVVSYILGIANHIISACMFKLIGFRNCPKMLKDSIQWANENGYDTDVDLEKITTQQCLKDKYYKAYYYARKYAYGNDIEIIESQVAFLQSMIVPLIFIGIKFFCCIVNFLIKVLEIKCCWVNCMITVVIYLFILACMLCFIFNRQKKIYDRVWEDYYYLKQL